MSSGLGGQKLNSPLSSGHLAEKQGSPCESNERQENQYEWTGPRASSPEPTSDEDQSDSLRTVRSASPRAERSASYSEINCQFDAPSIDRPLELSARQLFERQDGSSRQAAEAESREPFTEVDLRVASTSGRPQEGSISVVQALRQEPDQAPTISSMYTRSSPSTSFRYCFTERAENSSINYHSNERTSGERLGATSNQRPGANNCDVMRAFSEAQPKLSFASKRMKEYFESFKGRSGEGRSSPGSRRHHLYQFFKSTRTELVACLLFSVIVCQTLISYRVHQSGSSAGDLNNLLSGQLPNQPAHSVSSEASAPAQVAVQPQIKQQQQSQQFNANGRHESSVQLHEHVIVALVAAFGAATLTQVFGHISGCHLLPAISLALYFKGHISRARLASYLGAQSVGALAGVALLSLLTSSQTTSLVDHRQALSEALASSSRPPIGGTQQIEPSTANRLMRHRREAARHEQPVGATNRWPALSPIQATQTLEQRIDRSKRFVSASGGDEVIRRTRRPRQALATDAANETRQEPAKGLIPGSEAILLSIMDQREQELGARQHRSKVGAGGDAEEAVSASPAPTMNFGSRQQAGVLFNRISKSDSSTAGEQTSQLEPTQAGATDSDEASSRSSKVVLVASSSANGALPLSPGPLEPQGNARQSDNRTRTLEPPAHNATVVARRLVMVPLVTSHNVFHHASDSQSAATRASGHGPSLEIETWPTSSGRAEEELKSKGLRVKKRTRRQHQSQQIDRNSSLEQTKGAPHELASQWISHSNLLEFALPTAIMSSDSMRACIKRKYEQLISSSATQSSHQKAAELELTASEELAMRRLELVHCAGLSNGSQMFIFQLLATLLVVLTYLVNVDPRRVDVGFKSLSIGLAYFLAHLLTLTSGGFYGNPSELLALIWFSSAPASDLCRVEWLVYLIVPLVGALFGALSHEYIDFTSLRNRNKKLHLRRSFFSLESLADAELSTNNQTHLDAEKIHSSQRPLSSSLANGAAQHSSDNSNTQTRPTTMRPPKGAPGSLSASVSIGGSAHGSGSSPSSRGAGSQTSIVMLNETVSETDLPLERPRACDQRRASNQSSKQQLTSSQQRAPSSSPKSSLASRQTVTSDLLLDSNFLICCANSGRQQAESRLNSAQGSLASSLGCQRAPNGRRKFPAPASFCSLAGARGNEPSGAQFVCTSQFM